MSEQERYSTTDPFLAAWFRLQGVPLQGLSREGNRTRMHFDLDESGGLVQELAYRNSDFERFASLYSSTMDLLKRR